MSVLQTITVTDQWGNIWSDQIVDIFGLTPGTDVTVDGEHLVDPENGGEEFTSRESEKILALIEGVFAAAEIDEQQPLRSVEFDWSNEAFLIGQWDGVKPSVIVLAYDQDRGATLHSVLDTLDLTLTFTVEPELDEQEQVVLVDAVTVEEAIGILSRYRADARLYFPGVMDKGEVLKRASWVTHISTEPDDDGDAWIGLTPDGEVPRRV